MQFVHAVFVKLKCFLSRLNQRQHNCSWIQIMYLSNIPLCKRSLDISNFITVVTLLLSFTDPTHNPDNIAVGTVFRAQFFEGFFLAKKRIRIKLRPSSFLSLHCFMLIRWLQKILTFFEILQQMTA